MERFKPLTFRCILILICFTITVKSEDLLVSLIVNSRKCPEIIPIQFKDGKVNLTSADLKSCQVNLKDSSDLEIDNKSPDYQFTLNKPRLELILKIPSDLIEIEEIDATPSRADTGTKTYALGLNYDATLTHAHQQPSGIVLPEALFFTPYGFLKSSGLFRTSTEHKAIRLESTFIKEFPGNLTSLRVGDGITRPSSWTSAVRIGGIQWGSNFNTQENYVYYPLPSINGSAALQTPLEIFVNNSQVYSGQANSGPYEIDNIPVVSGGGNLRLESVDLLGRKVQIEAPYYVTPNLLKQGLQDFSYEAGKLRDDYGIKSNDYRQFAGIMTHRYGLTNTCTIGIHSELAEKTKLIGIDASKLIGNWALVTASGAISHTNKRRGHLIQASLTRHAAPFGFGLRLTTQNSVFRDLSSITYDNPQKLSLQAYIGYNDETVGSLSLSYTTQQRFNQHKIQLITANYQKTISDGYSFFVSTLKTLGRDKNYTILLGISKILDHHLIVDGTVNNGSNINRQSVSFNKGFSGNYGTLYRGRLNHEDHDITGEANMTSRTPYGDLSLLATHYQTGNLYQASVSGAVLSGQDSVAATQKVNSSIGIVTTDNIPNITVNNNNFAVGETSANGTLIIPNLNTFARANVSLEDKDIPLDISYDKSRKEFYTDSTSAYLVDFGLEKTINKSITVVHTDGSIPIPTGTTINWSDGTKSIVGFNGEVFLTNTKLNISGTADTHPTPCSISLDKDVINDTKDPTIYCHPN